METLFESKHDFNPVWFDLKLQGLNSHTPEQRKEVAMMIELHQLSQLAPYVGVSI